jgi:hypothetical protein
MGGRKSHASFMADDERNPFEVDLDENSEVDAGKNDQEEGGGVIPPPDRPIGTEILHIDAAQGPRWLKRIFDPALAARELGGEDFDDRFGDDKLRARQRALRAMANDPMQGWRPMIISTDATIANLEALADAAPNFRALFDIVVAAAQASRHAAMPLRLPPLLLVGPPGAGKSRAAYAIASALQTSVEKVPVTMQTGVGVLSGLDWTWRSPSVGAVARSLLTAQAASPILVLDEIDKSCPRSDFGQLLDPLHDLLEADTAREFRDEYLKLPMAADAILWIATANDLAQSQLRLSTASWCSKLHSQPPMKWALSWRQCSRPPSSAGGAGLMPKQKSMQARSLPCDRSTRAPQGVSSILPLVLRSPPDGAAFTPRTSSARG